ncbi:DNA-processing protein DprA [Longimicrobium sp.]|uniref:DNA-processing protein DprA n=1 Tax=Longimicrobium sp. TaxID=2029185 RepID=UPI002B7F1FF8|nr:DNA-processing protein DprA [Longimicrobium sp.]HSU15085.1 DNA-processing protein DprA [Longimicrobium sp.]
MPLSSSALEPILRLAIVDGIGPARLSALLARFGSAERVLAAREDELAAVPGFGREFVKRLRAAATDDGLRRTHEAMRTLREAGAVAITPDDAAYPDAFRNLPDRPYLLFAIGDLALLAAPGIGVVGTRSPTDYGRRTAISLSGELARAGLSIVSGMARGIDSAAHAAALDAGGTTVGVLGHGIDRVYPPENEKLFARVRERGLLLTELAPGEEPNAGNFPRRNRLIAALSLGVLVVEMGEKSGAQHTVSYALEQGKEVFAVPGPIGSPQSAGTNQLLKEGASLVTTAADILEELRGVGHAFTASAGPASPANPDVPPPPPADLAPDEAKVYAALTADPRPVDDIAAAAELAPSNVLAALLGLELRELVESLPGKQYRRR